MKNYGETELDGFVRGLKKVSDIVKSKDPDHIFAPVIGAVPFVDLLKIVDRHFPISNVVYLPNSSRFERREELMARWYDRFYEEAETGDKMKILCLDEVLSGSSAVIGYKQFQQSLESRAKKKALGFSDEVSAYKLYLNNLKKRIRYEIVGFGERGHARNPAFKRLENKKLVYTVEFDDVPTIDNIALNPIRLKTLKKQPNGRYIYLPEIDNFDVSEEYINFLRDVARHVGVDPSSVTPVNLSKIGLDLKRASI